MSPVPADYDKAVDRLKQKDGIRIHDLAQEIGISPAEARKIVNKADSEYEVGSSADFHYRIISE